MRILSVATDRPAHGTLPGLVVAALISMLALQTPASAHGWLIPKPQGLPPLAIKSQRVEVTIKGQVATTRMTQVFVNNTNRRLEATYVFPLPASATITDFSMMINGKLMRGELVEKGKARQIYQSIVRKMRDPALLEYIGSNLFKMSVFPIEPHSEQKIELTYSERLPYDAGICSYVFPLRTGEKASRVLEDHTFRVNIESDVPIKSVYSPTHEIDVRKTGDHKAVVGFEQIGGALDRDFRLYYTVSKKDLGVSLLTHRVKGKDGYFMLMVTPKEEFKAEEIVARDVTFVLDTSGSMSHDGKIEQAKRALKYCVSNLNARDRFNIIRFSTMAESFSEKPLDATKENVTKATEFIDGFVARGGTAIHEALMMALQQERDAKRPHVVVFITDGLPTIGTRNIDEILRDVKGVAGNTRVFSFGVGYDVNTRLLDTLSNAYRGASEYVKPKEDIEVKVSLFQNKVGFPVLADLKLDLGNIRVQDVFPRRLPDLFRGGQLVVLGRFSDEGDTAAKLTGSVNGKERVIAEDVKFPGERKDNDFIPRLWAQKQVAYLVGELRDKGENREVIDEVIRLSRRFGIMTPYTSYLVLEDEATYRRHGIGGPADQAGGGRRGWRARRRRMPAPAPKAASAERARSELRRSEDADEEALADAFAGAKMKRSRRPVNAPRAEAASPAPVAGHASARGPARAAADRKAEDRALSVFSRSRQREALRRWAASSKKNKEQGRAAVDFSEKLKDLRKRKSAAAKSQAIHAIGKRTFYRVYGVWVESSFGAGARPIKVKPFSDAYFKLMDLFPEFGRILAQGDYVIARAGKHFIQTSEDGIESVKALVKALR